MEIDGAGGGGFAVEDGGEIGIGDSLDRLFMLCDLHFELITVIEYRSAGAVVTGAKMSLPDAGEVLGMNKTDCKEQ